MTKSKWKKFLIEHNVDISKWGTGEAKTFDDFLSEVENRERRITVLKSGHLVSRVRKVTILVWVKHPVFGLLKLIEAKQVFKDGRVRIRKRSGSLSEKLKLNEKGIYGANRAIREELGISERLPLTRLEPKFKGPAESISFPGLLTLSMKYPFEMYLPLWHFKEEGFVEYQPEKTTYFVWKKISS